MIKDTLEINVKTTTLETPYFDKYYSDFEIKSSVTLELILNGTLINKFVNPYIIFENKNTKDFYPVSCSCGVPGCAGIFGGLELSANDTIVTWSTNPEDIEDYANIGMKQKYQFKTNEYENVVNQTKDCLHKIIHENPESDFFFNLDYSLRNFLMN